MIIKKIKKNRGFVILFAVTLSSILLAIALGVANIALKEIRFGTSAKDTNEAQKALKEKKQLDLENLQKILDKNPVDFSRNIYLKK